MPRLSSRWYLQEITFHSDWSFVSVIIISCWMALAAKLNTEMSHNWFRASVVSRFVTAARWFRRRAKRKVISDEGDAPTQWVCVCMCVCVCAHVRLRVCVWVSLVLSATSARHCLVLSRYPWWVGGPGLWDRQAFCGLSDRLCQMTRLPPLSPWPSLTPALAGTHPRQSQTGGQMRRGRVTDRRIQFIGTKDWTGRVSPRDDTEKKKSMEWRIIFNLLFCPP